MDQQTQELLQIAFKAINLLNEEVAIQLRLTQFVDERLRFLEMRFLRNVN